MKVPDFREMFNEVKKDKFYFTYKGIDVKVNDTLQHSLASRLKRASINMDNFIPDIKQAIDKSDKQGVYAYIKKDKNYKYLAKYNPRQNEMFVLTVLSPTMDRLDVDYKVVIECFEEFFNFELAENDYYIIRDSENDMEYFMESIDGNKTLTIIDDENNSLSIPVIEI